MWNAGITPELRHADQPWSKDGVPCLAQDATATGQFDQLWIVSCFSYFHALCTWNVPETIFLLGIRPRTKV